MLYLAFRIEEDRYCIFCSHYCYENFWKIGIKVLRYENKMIK